MDCTFDRVCLFASRHGFLGSLLADVEASGHARRYAEGRPRDAAWQSGGAEGLPLVSSLGDEGRRLRVAAPLPR